MVPVLTYHDPGNGRVSEKLLIERAEPRMQLRDQGVRTVPQATDRRLDAHLGVHAGGQGPLKSLRALRDGRRTRQRRRRRNG